MAQKAVQEVENYYHHSSKYPHLKKLTHQLEKEVNQDFSLDDNAVKKTLPPPPPKKRHVKDQTIIVQRR